MPERDDSDDPGHPDYWRKMFAESAAPFEPMPDETPSTETLRSLYSHVLRVYGYRCAMTGSFFGPPEDFLHDELGHRADPAADCGRGAACRQFPLP